MGTEEQFTVHFDKPLGKGSENEVYEATITPPVDPGSGEPAEPRRVAAKRLHLLGKPELYGINDADGVRDLFEGKGQLAVLLRELEEHQRLSDSAPPPELVRYMGTKFGELHGVKVPMWILIELCEGGSLAARMEAVHESGESKLLPREVFDIVTGVLRALEHIHEKGCVHRDIKPGNIFFDSDGTVKVGDLGFIRPVSGGEMTKIGTPRYVAPEVSTGTYGQSVDIFSLAVALMEISGVTGPRIDAARNRSAMGDNSGVETIVGELVAELPYLEPVLRAVLCPAAQRPSAKELLAKLRSAAGSAEERVPCAPPSYTCGCDDGDGGCQHEGEPEADQEWVYCPSCEDVYHASCFAACHGPKNMRGHKKTMRRLPPATSIRFKHAPGKPADSIAFALVAFGPRINEARDVYRRWARGEATWSQLGAAVAPAIATYVGACVGSWCGAAVAMAIVATAAGGPIALVICQLIGGVVGSLAGMVVGGAVADELYGSTETISEERKNAAAVVRAMEALAVYVNSPEDMTLDDVKKGFRNQALFMHPDKVHKKDTETEEEFHVRKAKAEINMQMLNHHYSVLKCYIEERETSPVWRFVKKNAAHSLERLWALVKEQKEKQLKGLLSA